VDRHAAAFERFREEESQFGGHFVGFEEGQDFGFLEGCSFLGFFEGGGDGLEGSEFGLEVAHVDALLVLLLFLRVEQVAVLGDPGIERFLIIFEFDDIPEFGQNRIVLSDLVDCFLPESSEGLLDNGEVLEMRFEFKQPSCHEQQLFVDLGALADEFLAAGTAGEEGVEEDFERQQGGVFGVGL
jgi:hypothetical protein